MWKKCKKNDSIRPKEMKKEVQSKRRNSRVVDKTARHYEEKKFD